MPEIRQTQETGDLTVLTIKRVRAAVSLALQLIEDDDQRASILIGVAVDMVNGAASLLEHDGKVPARSAMLATIVSVLTAVDDPQIKAMITAILHDQRAKKR
jgi:hypothetical protein